MSKKVLFILCFSIALFLCQTVVYSAINSTMSITGSSIARADADVRITNLKLNEISNNGSISNYEVFTKDSMSVSFTLNDSGTIYYDIEISNYTDNMVGIQNISDMPNGIEYSFTNYTYRDPLMDGIGSKVVTMCFTGDPGTYNFTVNFTLNNMYTLKFVGFDDYMMSTSDVFEGGTFTTSRNNGSIKNVFVTNSDNSIYKDFTFTEDNFSIPNIHSDLTITNNDSFINVKSGNIYKMNSEVCLGEECFYVVNSDSSSFRIFAKYNLYVGYDWDGSSLTKYGDEATGIQHPDMRGYIGEDLVRKGVDRFVQYEWWIDTLTTFPTYVYDSRSNFYVYMENYKDYLENNGAVINEARPISYEELVELGCNVDAGTCKGYSEEWVYYTSFWTGSAASANTSKNLWAVLGKSFIKNNGSNVSGVRPLIEINYSDL